MSPARAARGHLSSRVGAVLAAALYTVAAPAAADEGQAPARFAWVIGANQGHERATLAYAESDADAFAGVLTELGGVAPDRLVSTQGPDLAGARRAQAALAARIEQAAATGPTEVVVYYSGHSSDEGLLLRDGTLPYAEMRRWLEALPVRFGLLVLDSCNAGAVTRAKGGVHVPVQAFVPARDVRGRAYVTSAGRDEAAQESDALRGSFFTHFLVSGLRGAADGDADGQVTLMEAYRFAYTMTTSRTVDSAYGPQHPTYDIDLIGQGDVVLTELSATRSQLEIAGPVSGYIAVRLDDGRVLAEFEKLAGVPVVVALRPGRYEVYVRRGQRLQRAVAQLQDNQHAVVTARSLTDYQAPATVARGGGPTDSQRVTAIALTAGVGAAGGVFIAIAGASALAVANFTVLLAASGAPWLWLGLPGAAGLAVAPVLLTGGVVAAMALMMGADPGAAVITGVAAAVAATLAAGLAGAAAGVPVYLLWPDRDGAALAGFAAALGGAGVAAAAAGGVAAAVALAGLSGDDAE